jgi:predicted nucleotidyltransferase
MSGVHALDRQGCEQVIERLAAHLAGRAEVAFATVFGSFCEDRPFRDIDVAVWTADPAPPRLDLDLSVVLSRLAGFPVDVRRDSRRPVRLVKATYANTRSDLRGRESDRRGWSIRSTRARK